MKLDQDTSRTTAPAPSRVVSDAAALPQAALNIQDKTRSNLLPWRGQFSPQLVESLLRNYARADAAVLDPFVGSGTVLCESGRLGLSSVGAEINPAAATLARTYGFINLSQQSRESAILDLSVDLGTLIATGLPLLSRPAPARADVRNELVALHRRLRAGRKKTLLESLITLADFYSGPVTTDDLADTWNHLADLVRALPHSDAAVRVELGDARRLTLPDQSIDLVITSPPYINVFNYHQQYRASMEALSWDLLAVARAEIGSNRKHRANRFLTVTQYCLDMAQSLNELRRVCRRSARLILVLGRESRVRKTPFYNGSLVEALAIQCSGMSVVLKQERSFVNKFGERIYEDLLHLEVASAATPAWESKARQIGLEALIDATNRAPDESRADLDAAIRGVASVRPSPYFDLNAARSTSPKSVEPTSRR
ncbi:MAG: site-specific DNA-methyltransferase [Planctomycetes bacterium]|nr:site-specific DNA-methyltransferase [Planctomycetota bacterium]